MVKILELQMILNTISPFLRCSYNFHFPRIYYPLPKRAKQSRYHREVERICHKTLHGIKAREANTRIKVISFR